eukprot:3635771-Pyramimonas_sp.AAC.1
MTTALFPAGAGPKHRATRIATAGPARSGVLRSRPEGGRQCAGVAVAAKITPPLVRRAGPGASCAAARAAWLCRRRNFE